MKKVRRLSSTWEYPIIQKRNTCILGKTELNNFFLIYMNVGDGNQAISLSLIHCFCPSFIYGYETNDVSKIYLQL